MGLSAFRGERGKVPLRVLIVAIATLLLFGCSEPMETVVVTSISPNGGVVVEVRAGEAWAYSPHPVKIVKVVDKRDTVLQEMEIRNDGAILGSHNAKIEWTDDKHVTVTLNGQEQEAKSYSYEF